jgi:leader peptidase (prepilin peptidase)/N-methyltransferase
VPLIVLLSSFVGAIIGVGMIALRGHDRSIPIPFGPYLAMAGWIALMWGNQLIDAYMGISGMAQ